MINQTRTLLVVALLFVAYLLWQQWQHDYPVVPAAVASAPATASPTGSEAAEAPVPEASMAVAGSAARPPAATGTPVPPTAVASTPREQLIVVSSDVLRLTIDPRGGTIVGAELLDYPSTVKRGSAPVQLLSTAAAHYYVAQSGLVGAQGSSAPSHLTAFTASAKHYALAAGQDQVTAQLEWRDPASGVSVEKRYTLKRGSYAVGLTQQIDNHGSQAWQGSAYQQLDRVQPPAPPKHLLEFYNPENISYTGAAWYSPDDKFQKLPFDKFAGEPIKQSVTGGWIAMSQRFFVGAWIADAKATEQFSSVEIPSAQAGGQPRYLIRAVGPALSVAPGASASSQATLYVGPKLQNQLADIAPGLNLTVDYGWFTVVAQPMFKLLGFLHKLVGNWGVAIIALVLIIQALTWKLSDAQYRSGARMRKLQPRLQALKERFGDDKQKFQQAMMELYKKEKINPLAGCLPMFIMFPVFFALYYVLIFSVELRHAAFLWVPDLSAADPYFILPVLYTITMVGTSLLTPVQGMDPTQAKIMKFMPLLFSVIFYFFPAGLTLYYVVRGIATVGQQWHVTRQIERADAHARA